MNCRSFQKQMPLLLDKNPGGPAVDELLDHAQVCADCARELDASHAAMQALRPSQSIGASGRFRERTMQKIHQLETAENAWKPTVSAAARRNRASWKFCSRIAAAAAVVLLAFGLFDSSNGSGKAFAQVINELRKAASVSYVMSTKNPAMPQMPAMRMKTSYKDPGLIRMESENGEVATVFHLRSRKGISTMKEGKKYYALNLPDSATSDPVGMNLVENLRRLADSAGRSLGEKSVDGREAHGFRAATQGVEYDIWADKKDDRIVLVEFQIPNFAGATGTISEIEYSPQLDDSLFSIEPPQGYTAIADPSMGRLEPKEDDLVVLLRKFTGLSEAGTFPDTLTTSEMMKTTMKNRPSNARALSEDELLKETFALTLGWMFIARMTPENDWQYAGAGVRAGDATTPVCWWKPTGNENYRMVFGDFTIRDVDAAKVPPKTAAR